MEPYPIIKTHIKAWYRQGMDKHSQSDIKIARKHLLPNTPVPRKIHLNYQDRIIDGDFILRIFKPKKLLKNPSPFVVFIRASGYCMGSAKHHNLPCAIIANTLNCPVVGLEHRLSPEHKFPTPLNDCEHGVRWLHQHGHQFGLDSSQAAIIGECSGGNLAASLNHRLAAKKQSLFKHQLLLYPTLSNHITTASKQNYSHGYITDLAMLNFTMKQYLKDDKQRWHQEVSPNLNTHFKGLPTTHISIGEHDLFVDEAVDYANQLKQHGIPATIEVHPGLIHGYIRYYLHEMAVRDIIDQHLAIIKETIGLNTIDQTKTKCPAP